jgi:hypothetical protein
MPSLQPYRNGNPEEDYFADGMVEEIITALSRCAWLFVIARNSSFTSAKIERMRFMIVLPVERAPRKRGRTDMNFNFRMLARGGADAYP